MIISCGDLRLVGSTRHRKVVQNPRSILSRSHWWPCGSVSGVPKVAPEPSPYMVLRAVWLVALRLDGVMFQTVTPEPPPCILLVNIKNRTPVAASSKEKA